MELNENEFGIKIGSEITVIEGSPKLFFTKGEDEHNNDVVVMHLSLTFKEDDNTIVFGPMNNVGVSFRAFIFNEQSFGDGKFRNLNLLTDSQTPDVQIQSTSKDFTMTTNGKKREHGTDFRSGLDANEFGLRKGKEISIIKDLMMLNFEKGKDEHNNDVVIMHISATFKKHFTNIVFGPEEMLGFPFAAFELNKSNFINGKFKNLTSFIDKKTNAVGIQSKSEDFVIIKKTGKNENVVSA